MKIYEQINACTNANLRSDDEIKWDAPYLGSMPFSFIKEHIDKIDILSYIYYQMHCPEELLHFLIAHYDWTIQTIMNFILKYQNVSIDFINQYIESFDETNFISLLSQSLPLSFICQYEDKLSFPDMVKTQQLSENLIDKHFDELIRAEVVKYQTLSDDFLERHYHDFALLDILTFQQVGFQFITNHFDEIISAYDTTSALLRHQQLPEQFILDHFNDFAKYDDSLHYIAVYQKISPKNIEIFDTLYLGSLFSTQELPESILEKHKEFVESIDSSRFQSLSTNFLMTHQNRLSSTRILKNKLLDEDKIMMLLPYSSITLNEIPCYQKLSEEFIERYQQSNSLFWYNVFSSQQLSEEFLIKHFDKVFTYKEASLLDAIVKSQHLSMEFVQQFILDNPNISTYYKTHELPLYIKLPGYEYLENASWLYQSKEFKKEQIVNTKMFECYDDYFIAYKRVRNDGTSLFDIKFKYEKGKVSESTCDYTPHEVSFGLHVGPKKIVQLSPESPLQQSKVIKCKVRYEDVGYLTTSKLYTVRCCRLEVC